MVARYAKRPRVAHTTAHAAIKRAHRAGAAMVALVVEQQARLALGGAIVAADKLITIIARSAHGSFAAIQRKSI